MKRSTSRSTPVPTWSASCSFRRRRGISISLRHEASAPASKAAPARWRSRSMRPMPSLAASRRGARPRPVAAARQGNAQARARGEVRNSPFPVMKAIGGRDAGRPRHRPGLCRGRRFPAVRCARAPRRHPARRARQGRSTGGSCRTFRPSVFHSCFQAVSTPAMSPRHALRDPPGRGRRVVGGRTGARRKRPREDPRLHPRGAAGRGARRRQTNGTTGMSLAATQFLPQRAGRARPFRTVSAGASSLRR